METHHDIVLPKCFGWVGLGAMGWPMAKQLLKNTSAKLVIYDVDQSTLHRFAREASERVEIASSARQVADESECVFTIVPEGKHVKEVYLTPDTGLLAGKTSGKTFIDCSTIDIETSLATGEAVMSSDPEAAVHFFDCPVSGGTAGAAKGTITFMVGMAADDPRFPFIHAILSTMGSSINPMGGKGLGLAAKLSNNYLSGIIALATSEAMSIGMKLGIDPKVLSDTFDKGTGANWVNRAMNPVPGVCPDAATSKGYEGGFKDMKLAAEVATQTGVKLVLGESAIAAYSSAAADSRYRDKDSRVVYQW
ncbi:NAD binding domain of 6-phosphogluconate dehydrogenase-domain-containing protein [Mycena pura]|uniref:NAD binding domain of 6-phosphogluconate dehydrogenase-domain-containing protein n=1 Tax=Mycena pura TaxID=153505 RepID=A0AAD6VPC5_9AGAR|nr:NAD binding domain of 6-phosphogluconate dehydrogenase-domain-containing protein [Mycena pura]